MATKTQIVERQTFRARLRDLYEGNSQRSHRFRYGLLAFDLLTVLFVVVTSFMQDQPGVNSDKTGNTAAPTAKADDGSLSGKQMKDQLKN